LNLVTSWVLGLVVPLLFTGHVELIFVPGVLSLNVRSDFGMRVLRWISSNLSKSWKHLISGWVLGLVIPLLLAGHVELILVPGVFSLNVWGDFGVRIFAWISTNLGKSWLNLVTRWVFGLVIPLLLTGHVEFIFVPGVFSLDVRGNFGMRIFAWIGTLLNKLLTSLLSSLVVFKPVLVTLWISGLSIPGTLVHGISLIVIPSSKYIWIIAPFTV